MKILNVQQGSQEWKIEREKRFTASEAAAVFGEHKYMSRADLQYQKKCQPEQEVSPAKQKRFDDGHAAEAEARPIAEGIIDDELFPVTGVSDEDDRFLASLDGLTMNRQIGFEHKWLNNELADAVEARDLPEHYKHQMDHQMMVSEKTEKILFMASKGTEESAVWMWYLRDEDRIKRLIAGWDQFEKDLAEYEPPKHQAKAEGSSPETLPALRIQVSGEVTDSNLTEFREHAMAVIQGINTDLQTDDDFASAEKATKWCKEVEQRLDAAKDHALSQTQTIDELFRTLDEIKEQARQTRLNLDKQVKASKQAKRDEIFRRAEQKYDAHIEAIESELASEFGARIRLPVSCHTIADAMKGKKTLTSLQSAADEALANDKLAVNELADRARSNLKQLDEHAPGHRFLFNDLDRIAAKEPEDFAALVKNRVMEYERAEEQRREREEKERIEREEAERQKNEAAQAQELAREESAKPQQEPAGIAREAGRELEETLRKAQDPLEVWQQRHGISDQAMAELHQILNRKAA